MADQIVEARLAELKKKLEDLLVEYNAALVPITLISGDKVLSRVDIVPVSNQN